MKRRAALGAGIATVILAAVLVAPLAAGWLVPVPDFEQVRGAEGSDAALLDRSGVVLQQLRLDPRRRQLAWTPLDEVSPALRDAVVAAEDRRFRVHPGVDPIALVSAALDNFERDRPRGASTITMQLAGLLDDDGAPTAGRGPAPWTRKARQMLIALSLERHWTKQQILEAYVNRVDFRGELVGVRAAAYGLFGVGPGGLERAQAAVLAALVRSPAAAGQRLERRACRVLRAAADAAGDADAADCRTVGVAVALLPRRALPIPGAGDAPHLARRLLTAPGQRLATTLDAGLQRFAAEALRNQLAALEARHVDDGAVVVLDNASGAVLAYVGGGAVDAVAASRQPGSALKPFLYELAVEDRWLTAASVLDDAPLSVPTPAGNYEPQNYDHAYRGAVTVRTALASSLNVPAVRTLQRVGVDAFAARLRELGLATLTRDARFYGAGLALGDGEVSLLELANAYRALARGGLASPLRFLPDEPPATGRRVMDDGACFIVADILADPAARATTFGLGSVLGTPFWSAVKTGTSKGMRDNWALGFSDRYTVGVWVGNSGGEPMWNVSGTTGAAPVWRAVIEYLHARRPGGAPPVPAGVERVAVAFVPAFEPARGEWFLSGTQTGRVVLLPRDARPRIASPLDGTVIAIDPDIPPARQSLRIALVGARATQCATIDGAALGLCGPGSRLAPVPTPGRHEVTLRDERGQVIDRAVIEVRGVPRSGAG